MKSPHQIKLPRRTVQSDSLLWFRFGRLGEHIILTTDTGSWHALSPEQFSRWLAGDLSGDDPEYIALRKKGFVRNGFDIERHAETFRRTKRLIETGPTHHHLHLSTARGSMELDVAKKLVDHILAAPSKHITLRLIQGPYPVQSNVLSFIHDFAEQKNQYEQKAIRYQLQSQRLDLNDECLQLLVTKPIHIHTAFDGSESVHNHQRELTGAITYADALAQLRAICAASDQSSLQTAKCSLFSDVHLGIKAIGKADEIVAGLAKARIQQFRVIPILDGPQALSIEAFRTLYQQLLNALSSHANEPDCPIEVNAAALISRLNNGDSAETVMRCTPPSSGLTSRSYGPNGEIFPSCSALRLHEQGDSMFHLGNVAQLSIDEVSKHETIRSLVVASLPDCLPGYQHLWSTPFIGVDPVSAYEETGDIFTRMPTSRLHHATQVMVEAVVMACLEEQGI